MAVCKIEGREPAPFGEWEEAFKRTNKSLAKRLEDFDAARTSKVEGNEFDVAQEPLPGAARISATGSPLPGPMATPKRWWRRVCVRGSNGVIIQDRAFEELLREGRDSGKWRAGIRVEDGSNTPLAPSEVDFHGLS